MEDRRTLAVDALRLAGDPPVHCSEHVLIEAPLEVYLGDALVATTMRTPGDDFELALGLLWSEGRISGSGVEVRRCPDRGSPLGAPDDVVCVEDAPATRGERSTASPRLGLTASSCGVCGVEQIEALVAGLERLEPPPMTNAELLTVVDGMGVARAQELFALTGGAHAAAVTDAQGTVVAMREDIGRHNAVDKVVGRLLLDGMLPAERGPAEEAAGEPSASDATLEPVTPVLMWVSGRASFEIVQKGWAAGIPVVVSIGAVSALAVETARRAGVTLLGFARDGRATLYTGPTSPGRLRPRPDMADAR